MKRLLNVLCLLIVAAIYASGCDVKGTDEEASGDNLNVGVQEQSLFFGDEQPQVLCDCVRPKLEDSVCHNPDTHVLMKLRVLADFMTKDRVFYAAFGLEVYSAPAGYRAPWIILIDAPINCAEKMEIGETYVVSMEATKNGLFAGACDSWSKSFDKLTDEEKLFIDNENRCEPLPPERLCKCMKPRLEDLVCNFDDSHVVMQVTPDTVTYEKNYVDYHAAMNMLHIAPKGYTTPRSVNIHVPNSCGDKMNKGEQYLIAMAVDEKGGFLSGQGCASFTLPVSEITTEMKDFLGDENRCGPRPPHVLCECMRPELEPNVCNNLDSHVLMKVTVDQETFEETRVSYHAQMNGLYQAPEGYGLPKSVYINAPNECAEKMEIGETYIVSMRAQKDGLFAGACHSWSKPLGELTDEEKLFIDNENRCGSEECDLLCKENDKCVMTGYPERVPTCVPEFPICPLKPIRPCPEGAHPVDYIEENGCPGIVCEPDVPECTRECPEGYEGYFHEVHCIRAPCPPIQECRPIPRPTCATTRCEEGKTCYDMMGGPTCIKDCTFRICPDGQECYMDETPLAYDGAPEAKCREPKCREPKCPTSCAEFCPMAMDCTLPKGCENPGCGCPEADCD